MRGDDSGGPRSITSRATTGPATAVAIARAMPNPAIGTTLTARPPYYTDAMGQPLASSNPLALRQEISLLETASGAPATTDGLVQFKMLQGLLPAKLRSWA